MPRFSMSSTILSRIASSFTRSVVYSCDEYDREATYVYRSTGQRFLGELSESNPVFSRSVGSLAD